MTRFFKTKDEALKFIKKLSFDNIRYNEVKIRKIGKEWVVSYE
jgi:hypothetical protein